MALLGTRLDLDQWATYGPALAAQGVTHTPITFRWDQIQTGPNSYGGAAALDAVVAAARSYGLKLLVHLELKGWACVNPPAEYPNASTPPLDPSLLYNFTRWLVARMGDVLVELGPLNEAALLARWYGAVATYFDVLATMYDAAHDERPAILITNDGFSFTNSVLVRAWWLIAQGRGAEAVAWANGCFVNWGPEAFFSGTVTLDQLIAARDTEEGQRVIAWWTGLLANQANMDGLQVHWYGSVENLVTQLRWFREQGMMLPFRFWELSEGWETDATFDPAWQARRLPQMLATALGEGGTQGAWWRHVEIAGTGVRGLYDPTGVARPALGAYSFAAGLLKDVEDGSGRPVALGAGVTGYRYERAGAASDLYALWAEGGASAVDLGSAWATARVHRMDGSVAITNAATLAVGPSVVFVEGANVGAINTQEAAPLLSLEQFRRIAGFHPWHFWGLSGEKAPVTSNCNAVVKQYAWQQAQAAGRNEISQAIERAEGLLREHLGYSVAPRYMAETLVWPTTIWNGGVWGADGRPLAVRLSEGYLQAVGAERLTLVDDNAPLTFSDTNGDGLLDSWLLTVPTTVTDPTQLAVYFSAAERWGGAAVGEAWRVQPLGVTISGGVATIRGRAWQVVKPLLYETGMDLDPAVTDNFAPTLDVYRRDTNGDQQATFTWDADAGGCSAGSDPAGTTAATGRVALRDAKLGIVAPLQATLSGSAWAGVPWGAGGQMRPPDRVTINALAGLPLERGEMARQWQFVVARLAMAEMGRAICACDAANREVYYWQFDLARAGGANQEQYRIAETDLDNPFGTARGHVQAWRAVRAARLVRGLAI